MLKDARRLAKNMPPAKKAAIEKICAEIDELAKELATLQASGQVRVCVVHVGPRVIHIQAALQPLKIQSILSVFNVLLFKSFASKFREKAS